MAEPRHFVVGTAGHVDHGKTALVRALTGVDCDRLPEEKARGISIELGFASWSLGAGLSASVIDVPGHERFVRTMVAGAAGLDAVILVVAADDGVMPQTREHLEVCRLLGIRVGVVALTMCDRVDAELLALARDDVGALAAGTFLEAAPVIACSALRGEGLAELTAAVAAALARASPRPTSGPLFVPVDRVFLRPGFGTVVTGTLVRGAIAVGDVIDALPGPGGSVIEGLRVRGIQVHDRAVERAEAACRVAINLRGEGAERVARGMALASAGWQRPTDAILAEIELLAGVDTLHPRELLTLHLGATQVVAAATLIEAAAPGVAGLWRLAGSAPFACHAGQRLVLRRATPEGPRTCGGGLVVDPHPGRARAALLAAAPRFFRARTAPERIAALVEGGRDRGVSEAEARRRLAPDEPVAEGLGKLEKAGKIVRLAGDPPRWVSAGAVGPVAAAIRGEIAAFHAAHPLLYGPSLQAIGGQLPGPQGALAAPGLAALVARREAVIEGGLVRLAGHDPAAGASLGALAARYEAAGLAPPGDEELRRDLGLSPGGLRDAVAELRRQGRLRATGGLVFAATALDALVDRVRAHLALSPELTPADLKQIGGGLTRKHAIPLLEWLDAAGVTRRRGEVRVAGPAARPGEPMEPARGR
jgi:selenocysteine-specific elongation factor